MAGLLSLSKALKSGLGERKSQCAILELDDNDVPTSNEYLAFQYFPETISDTKAVHYQTKEIPGGSLPLYQWTSGGERTISFTAVFSSDVDLISDAKAFDKLRKKGYLKRNVDIRTALLWLRRFMLPRYGAMQQLGVPLTKAPRKLILRISNSGIGLNGGDVNNHLGDAGSGPTGANIENNSGSGVLLDSMIAIMMQCDITYEAFFPSGMPRVATVQLAFAQIAQVGGLVNFPSNSDFTDGYVKSGSQDAKLFPYPIKVKFE